MAGEIATRRPEAGRSAPLTHRRYPVDPHPAAHDKRRSWRQDGEGAAAVLLPVQGIPDNLPKRMGRSQVVRQRILMTRGC
jgi:hypothetical protein